MDSTPKPEAIEDFKPEAKPCRNTESCTGSATRQRVLAGGGVNAIDVKRTLHLRHQTALAWVMPESWEPLHN